MNILLTADEKGLVINKATEEAYQLHQNPNGTPNPAGAKPLTETDWDPNNRVLVHLEH